MRRVSTHGPGPARSSKLLQEREHQSRRKGGGPPCGEQRPLHSIGNTTGSSRSATSAGDNSITGALTSRSTSTRDLAAGGGDVAGAGRCSPTGDATKSSEQKRSRRMRRTVNSISPSSIAEFKRYILGLKHRISPEAIKGQAIHEALFRFSAAEEGFKGLGILRKLSREIRKWFVANEKEIAAMGYSSFAVKDRLTGCQSLPANSVTMEGDSGRDWQSQPEYREQKFTHTFALNERTAKGGRPKGKTPASGAATAARAAAARHFKGKAGSSLMTVVGVVDRIDRCSDGKLRVVDYKTGKVPDLKYPEATNKMIMDEKFFQLQIYSLLVQRVLGETPIEMRLEYVSHAKTYTRKIDPKELVLVESELRNVWNDIGLSVRRKNFPPRPSKLCDWCTFQDRCPTFAGAPKKGKKGV